VSRKYPTSHSQKRDALAEAGIDLADKLERAGNAEDSDLVARLSRAVAGLAFGADKRALNALDLGLKAQMMAHRWRQIGANAPPGSKLDMKAADELQRLTLKAWTNFRIVRLALGEDVDADAPPPTTHWQERPGE
jgi:hypothetical protein